MGKKLTAIQTIERRERAVALRRAGLTYSQIGEQLGVSRQAAYVHVAKVVDELITKTTENAEQVLQIELDRLDAATAVVMRGIEEGDLASIDRLIKIQERRARLLGLDAPAQSDVLVTQQQVPTVIIAEPVSPQLTDDTKH